MLLLLLLLIGQMGAAPMRPQSCSRVPLEVLRSVLGGAYNAHYMSVDVPLVEDPTFGTPSGKRTTKAFSEDFFVEENFSEEISSQPAWEVSDHVVLTANTNVGRHRRQVDYAQEWHCESELVWTDLGPEYFPRYLRSVRCSIGKCWYGIYQCKPRAFIVKVLRRKSGTCAGGSFGTRRLPHELREKWVWEKKAVNFCCDCVPV